MPNPAKSAFLAQLASRFGGLRKLEKSQSLFEVGDNRARLYFRYSKRHARNRTFFGLRKVDLQVLEGHLGIVCFLWEGQQEPLFVPYSDFEEVFASLTPARDGQFKVQVYQQLGGTELYIATAGRFNVESYIGWDYLGSLIESVRTPIPELSHVQVQTLLGGIGAAKGFDIWIPPNDRPSLDWAATAGFHILNALPQALFPVKNIAEGVDVIWVERGAGLPAALYEVEHSTPVYSGLLRFNDVHLTLPSLNLRFGIVSNHDRRALFVRQLGRPTFRASGLSEVCAFFEYRNVYGWHHRIHAGSGTHG